jgi:hypothetical protein
MNRLAHGTTVALVVVLLFVGGGGFITLATDQLASLPKRGWVVVAIGAALVVFAIASKRPKSVLLCSWVIALTYNRQSYSFDAVTGNNGPAGLYWIAADFFLLCLLVLWVLDVMRGQRPSAWRHGALALVLALRARLRQFGGGG